ncbi:DNA primase [Candidatus Methylacidithermus pantelleriae]|uniref:DNA primase n=1 Tax=Candidatus Methylacidithermus pantelleriae TaxID=2744239 RepID=A0A8J2BNK1_9BACT|nr:DNA primase [Candidatus Methylacidithermus pantelleriae]CAF0693922.1 DNA primase [Candidatus Methylacidithermus pantelleriae]
MSRQDLRKIIEEVRAANDIVEVIGGYVALRRAGSQYKGLSPFTAEKNPSFFVDPVKQVFKCWSSGHGGTVFDFIMLYENVDFLTALRRLAERAGIDLSQTLGGSGKDGQRRQKLYHVCQAVGEFWARLLRDDPGAQSARKYLADRGISRQIWEELGLGFAPDGWQATLGWAQQEGMEPDLLVEAGLAIRSSSGRPYDRFRNRVIFPIRDEQGRTVGFSGRILQAQPETPKYINSAESPIFSKGKILFGLDRAKRAIAQAGYALLCEGPMDWVQCHQAGLSQVVAVQGTSFTQEQANLLRRFCRRVVVCFDADPAGERATARTFELLLSCGLEVEILCLPPGEDPDSFLCRYGRAAFEEKIAQAAPYIRFLLDVVCRRFDLTDPGGCAEASGEIAQALAVIPDPVYREKALWEAAARLGVSFRSLERRVGEAGGTREPKREGLGEGHISGLGPVHPTIRALASLLLAHPEYAGIIDRELSREILQSFVGGSVVADLVAEELSGDWQGAPHFLDRLPKGPLQSWLAGLLLDPEPIDPELDLQSYARGLANQLKELWRQQRIERLEQEIRAGQGTAEEILAKTRELLDLRRVNC